MKTKHLTIIGIAAAVGIAAIFGLARNGGDARKSAATPPHSTTSTRAAATIAGSGAASTHPANATAAAARPATSSIQASAAAPVGAPLAEPIPADATTARVTVDGKEQTLAQDDIGNYPVLNIKARTPIPVTLSFPKGQPGDAVLVRVEDGGKLDAKDAAKLLNLDPKKLINFDFASNLDNGIYRIVATKGSETSVLQFWVGPEMPHAHRTLDAKTASSN